jgi:hypothetical protein
MDSQETAPHPAHAIEALSTGERLVLAILDHQIVRLRYQGLERIVEPYLLGIHEAGEPLLVAFQLAGGSESGGVPGWRNFISTAIEDVQLTGERFEGARSDLNAAAHPMLEIFARA